MRLCLVAGAIYLLGGLPTKVSALSVPETTLRCLRQVSAQMVSAITGGVTSVRPTSATQHNNGIQVAQLDRVSQRRWILSQKLPSQNFSAADLNSFTKLTAPGAPLAFKNHTKLKGAEVAFSDPFLLDDSRYGIVALVDTGDGFKHPRAFYLSGSQGTWRAVSHLSDSGWFGKGLGEASMVVPGDLQSAFNARLSNAPQSALKDPVITEAWQGPLERRGSYDVPRDLVNNSAITEIELLPPLHPPASKRNGKVELPDPRDVRLKPAQSPNFAVGPERVQRIQSPVYGQVIVETYTSQDGQLLYTVMRRASDQRVWIANIEYQNIGANNYGTPLKSPTAPGLTTPLAEYMQQIPIEYHNTADKYGRYSSTWQYLRRVPVIQDYYKQRGLPMPD